MAQQRTKRQPGKRSGASVTVFAGATDNHQSNTRNRHNQVPGEIACYSGRTLDGWLQPRNGRFLAFRADGSFIGSFASSTLAARSIYEAAGQGAHHE